MYRRQMDFASWRRSGWCQRNSSPFNFRVGYPLQVQFHDRLRRLRRRPVSPEDFRPTFRIGFPIRRIFRLRHARVTGKRLVADGLLICGNGFPGFALPDDPRQRTAARRSDVIGFAQRAELIILPTFDRECLRPKPVKPFTLIAFNGETARVIRPAIGVKRKRRLDFITRC
jgi:hypothetical protein